MIQHIDHIFSFSRAFRDGQARGMSYDEALGWALRAEYASREPVLDRENLLAGMPGSQSLVKLDIGGLTCNEWASTSLQDTSAWAEARETIDQWAPLTTAAAFARACTAEFTPAEQALLSEPSLGWGGNWGGHAILSYVEVLADGIAGIQRRIALRLQQLNAETDADALQWFHALQHVCDGITTFIDNHARRATELAATTNDTGEVAYWQEIADCCQAISRDGARTFRQAVQLLWFIHLLDNTDSPGRIDQFLYPYYLQLGDDPATRRAAAGPVLDALWRKFIDCRSWNVCIGGQTRDGHDAVNELSYLFLDLQEQYNREAPNLSARFYHGTDPAFITRCAQVIGKGSGMPALYNDEVIVPALCDIGIALEDARDYALNGCMQIDIAGKSHMGLEDGEVNLIKCLELALHGGMSPVTQQQVGPKTLPPDAIGDFDKLIDLYCMQVKYATKLFTRKANVFQRVIAETAPHLFRSLFMPSCLESGRDIKRGGARYNHGQFLTQGVANTADSLYAIQRLVFEEQRMSLAELVTVLDRNWDGYEELRREICEHFPRYGNDMADVDDLAVFAVEHYFAFLHGLTTWRGGIYTGGVIVFNRAPEYGRGLNATADGRLAGTPVADSIGPIGGRDRQGPTAMLRSAARLPHRLACSGFCLNLKLARQIFTGDGAAALLRGYFGLGGQQLQVNVLDAATLQAARNKPEEYPNLVVRVGGFSARFVTLEPALQDEIIARTEHAV